MAEGRPQVRSGKKGTPEGIPGGRGFGGGMRQAETVSILVVISTLEDSTAIIGILPSTYSIFGSKSR